jgi:hypothetical protein
MDSRCNASAVLSRLILLVVLQYRHVVSNRFADLWKSHRVKVHRGVIIFSCYSCGESFSTEELLNCHVGQQHGRDWPLLADLSVPAPAQPLPDNNHVPVTPPIESSMPVDVASCPSLPDVPVDVPDTVEDPQV